MVYGRKQASKQASKQANMHTHVCNAVSLVWGLLRLVPTRQVKLQIDSESVMNLVNVLTQHALDWTAHGQLSIVIQFAISNYYPITCPQFKHSNYSSCFEVKLQLQITVFENCNCYVVITFGFQITTTLMYILHDRLLVWDHSSVLTAYVAVPRRNRTLFHCVFRLHYHVWSAVAQYFR